MIKSTIRWNLLLNCLVTLSVLMRSNDIISVYRISPNNFIVQKRRLNFVELLDI